MSARIVGLSRRTVAADLTGGQFRPPDVESSHVPFGTPEYGSSVAAFVVYFGWGVVFVEKMWGNFGSLTWGKPQRVGRGLTPWGL